MTDPTDDPDACPWVETELRDWGAGLCKSLILARRATEPGFPPAAVLTRWFGSARQAAAEQLPARTHLWYVERDLRRLRRVGFLPTTHGSSAVPVPGPDRVNQLAYALVALACGDPGGDDADEVARLIAAVGRHADPTGWVGLVEWGELPRVRELLDQFPEPPRRPSVKPEWDPVKGKLRYQGRLARPPVAPQAKSVRTVLNAFALDVWPERVTLVMADLPAALRSLRRGLKYLTFSADGPAGVAWAPSRPPRPSRP